MKRVKSKFSKSNSRLWNEKLFIIKSINTTTLPSHVEIPDGEWDCAGLMPCSKSKESDK